MFKVIRLTLLLMLSLSSYATQAAGDALWQDIRTGDLQAARSAVSSSPLPKKYRLVSLDRTLLQTRLSITPSGQQQALRSSQSLITLPLPEGGMRTFRIVESSVMAPELAAKYPQLKTYQGEAVDNPAVTVRLDWTEAGFHAMIFSGNEVIYIDPYQQGNTQHYLNYYKRDAQVIPRKQIGSDVIDNPKLRQQLNLKSRSASPVARSAGGTLRTYRIAVAATGEYTQFQGGTKALGLSAVVTAINRVTGIYEKELAARLQLVGNNDLLIYTNAATDPYSNADANALLSENQSNLDALIGSANYDIGHVFSTGGGGLASLGVVCDSFYKGQGETGSSNPTGDAFWVDYVAHEIGHQFGGDHTFNSPNGSCAGNGEPLAAYEIGSGSTIMAYAGICGVDDLQPNSDPYFHSHSFDQINTYITTGTGGTCGTASATGNTPPTVNAGASGLVIPKQTPFMLAGSGSDANGDTLSYSWEEYDLGSFMSLAATKAGNTPAGNMGTVPLFRALPPIASANRYLPKYATTLSNSVSNVELLPNYERQLNFRLTARDNRGGVTVSPVKTLSVTNLAGPFSVSYPNTAVAWEAGKNTAIVRWNVANTNLAPVSCSAVNIYLTAGASTFTLLNATPNDGLEIVDIPATATTAGRIKISCNNNLFFDLSNTNLTVSNPATPHFTLQAAYGAQTGTTVGAVFCAIPTTTQNVALAVGSVASFANPVTLSYLNLPTGFSGNFSVNGINGNTVSSPYSKNVKSSFNIPANAAAKAYAFQIQGTATSATTKKVNVELGIATTILLSPTAGSKVTTLKPTLSWLPVTGATGYTVQVATDSAFTNKVVNTNIGIATTYTLPTNLAANTAYYWRVQTVNGCSKGLTTTSLVRSFTTAAPTFFCSSPAKTDPSLITDSLVLTGTQVLKDLNVSVQLTHSWIGDVSASLTHVATGKTINLMPNLLAGDCSSANLNTTFDDESATVLTCSNTTGGGTRKPLQLLSGFDGDSLGGEWRLDIPDMYPSLDIGTLQQWCLYPTL